MEIISKAVGEFLFGLGIGILVFTLLCWGFVNLMAWLERKKNG